MEDGVWGGDCEGAKFVRLGVGLCVPIAKGESVPSALAEACGEPLQELLCVGRSGEAVGEKDPEAVPLGKAWEGVAVRVPTPPPPKLLPLGDGDREGVREDCKEGVGAPEGVNDPDPPEEALEVGEKGGDMAEVGEIVERRFNEGVELPVPPPTRRGVKEEVGEKEPPTLVGEGDKEPLPVALGEGEGERLLKEEGEEEGEGVEEALPPPPPAPAPAPPPWEDGEARLVREGDADEDGEGEVVGVLFTEKLPSPPPADTLELGVEERVKVENAVAVSPWSGEGVSAVDKVGVCRDVGEEREV